MGDSFTEVVGKAKRQRVCVSGCDDDCDGYGSVC